MSTEDACLCCAALSGRQGRARASYPRECEFEIACENMSSSTESLVELLKKRVPSSSSCSPTSSFFALGFAWRHLRSGAENESVVLEIVHRPPPRCTAPSPVTEMEHRRANRKHVCCRCRCRARNRRDACGLTDSQKKRCIILRVREF